MEQMCVYVYADQFPIAAATITNWFYVVCASVPMQTMQKSFKLIKTHSPNTHTMTHTHTK